MCSDTGELWHSSGIASCDGSHCVKTSSGSTYILLGDMDTARAVQESKLNACCLLVNSVCLGYSMS